MAIKKKPKEDKPRFPAMAEIGLYPAYILRGIVYLPHYTQRLYVRPGYGFNHWETYAGIELKAMGAQMVTMSLLRRAAFEELKQ